MSLAFLSEIVLFAFRLIVPAPFKTTPLENAFALLVKESVFVLPFAIVVAPEAVRASVIEPAAPVTKDKLT